MREFLRNRLAILAGGRAVFHDAFVRFSFWPAVRVTLGWFKRAFDRFALDAPPDQSLVTLDGAVPGLDVCPGVGGACSFGRLAAALRVAGRDVGRPVQGAAGPSAWLATLANGTGINATDENDAESLSGRLQWRTVPRLRLGGQLASHDYLGDGAEGSRYADAWSLDAAWGSWRDGLHLQTAVAGERVTGRSRWSA